MYTLIYTLCVSLHIHGLMGSIHNFFFFGCKLLFSTGIVDVSCHTVSVVVLCFCNVYANASLFGGMSMPSHTIKLHHGPSSALYNPW